MPNQRFKPAVQKALEWLLDSLELEKFHIGQKLPSIKDLSSNAGVSLASMHKAYAILRAQNFIKVRPGTCGIVGSYSDDDLSLLRSRIISDKPQEALAVQRPWQRVAQQLESDIYGRRYDYGSALPSYKELLRQYETSFRTLKRALAYLCAQGMLVPYKRSYRIKQSTPDAAHYRIGIIMFCSRERKLVLSGVVNDFFQATESLCMQLQIGIDLFMYDTQLEPLVFYNYAGEKTECKDRSCMLGYMYVAAANENKRERILRMLSHFKKPVAILDMFGGWNMPHIRNQKYFRIFQNTVGSKSGYDMARFLYEQNHRNILYLSPFHSEKWSQNRLRGIQDFAEHVKDMTVSTAVIHRPGKIFIAFKDEALRKCDVSGLQNMFELWKKDNPAYFGKELQNFFDITLPYIYVPQAEFRQRLQALFQKALMNKAATAWIAANDDIALWAMAFLAEKGIRVPGRISIVGFDNTSDSLRAGLTSYNFNMGSMATVIINYIRGIKSSRSISAGKKVEIKGVIISRSSTSVRH